MMMNKSCNYRTLIEKAENELCGLVNEKRLGHIFSVRKTATELCDFFISLGADISRQEIELSALLHDVTKCMEQYELCERFGIRLSDDDTASPETLHALTGAYFAKEYFRVSDKVFSSIQKHTVGSENMSLEDKIIFVSDYCEETRSHSECKASRTELLALQENVRKLPESVRLEYAKSGLDFIIAEILAKTVTYLEGKNLPVHRKTVSSYMALISLHKEDKAFVELKNEYEQIMKKYC